MYSETQTGLGSELKILRRMNRPYAVGFCFLFVIKYFFTENRNFDQSTKYENFD